MNKEIATQVANEIKSFSPHITTHITAYKDERYIIGIFTLGEDGSLSDCDFTIGSEYEWNRIKGMLRVLAPQIFVEI